MNRPIVHISLAITALIYGGTYLVAKSIMPSLFLPFGLIAIRVLSASFIFGVILLALKTPRIQRQDYLKLLLCALTGVAANQLMFFKGLSLTHPVNASTIMVATPVLVLLASITLLNERITYTKSIGVALGLLGALGIMAGKGLHFSGQYVVGDILIFLNALSYGVYLVMVKSLMAKYHPIQISFWVFILAIPIVVPIGAPEWSYTSWSEVPGWAWACLAYIIVGTTVIAYLLNIWALKHAESSLVGFYIYFQPLVATILTILFGMELPAWNTWAGAALIIIGVGLVNRR